MLTRQLKDITKREFIKNRGGVAGAEGEFLFLWIFLLLYASTMWAHFLAVAAALVLHLEALSRLFSWILRLLVRLQITSWQRFELQGDAPTRV
mgnify:CR=1 FL=1